jgi:hypothetical protein
MRSSTQRRVRMEATYTDPRVEASRSRIELPHGSRGGEGGCLDDGSNRTICIVLISYFNVEWQGPSTDPRAVLITGLHN